jgi:ribose/xylose/arabinose/galactoside ABC-type transport system permease subunit
VVVKLVALTISCLCGALAAMASRIMGAEAIMAMSDLMDLIAAAVIGGAALLGAEGKIVGPSLEPG